MNRYDKAVRPLDPKVKAEAKIILKNDNPIQFVPRRLSYTDKEIVKDILDKLKKKKYVRESTAEYTAPIVLTRKKMVKLKCVQTIEHKIKKWCVILFYYPLSKINWMGVKGQIYF